MRLVTDSQPRDTVGSIGMRLVTDSQPRDTVGSIGMRLVTDSQPRDTVGSIGMRLVTDSQPRDTVGSIGMRLVTDRQPRDTVGSIGMRLVTDSQPRDTVGSIGMRLVTDSQPRNTVGQDRPPIRVNGGGRQLTVDLARRAHQSPGRLADEDGLRGLPLAQRTGQGQSGVAFLVWELVRLQEPLHRRRGEDGLRLACQVRHWSLRHSLQTRL